MDCRGGSGSRLVGVLDTDTARPDCWSSGPLRRADAREDGRWPTPQKRSEWDMYSSQTWSFESRTLLAVLLSLAWGPVAGYGQDPHAMRAPAMGTAVNPDGGYGQPLVPGSGRKLDQVGDDFEDENWQYLQNLPKSTRDVDQQDRFPVGEAANGRWYEGSLRGQPDVVKRVPTPAEGLPGSRGSLLLQSLWTGIPGQPRVVLGQDDLIADVNYLLQSSIPAAMSPSVVVRVFLPPVTTWENRTGPHFGFRVALETRGATPSTGARLIQSGPELETYWPGMFIEFQTRTHDNEHYYAHLRIRANEQGHDFRSKQITATGWWTLGMSLTPDGMVHYYASPGVDALTSADYLGSLYPYGYRAIALKTFFFNVCNGDDGRSWSTAWIIDDPSVFVARQ